MIFADVTVKIWPVQCLRLNPGLELSTIESNEPTTTDASQLPELIRQPGVISALTVATMAALIVLNFVSPGNTVRYVLMEELSFYFAVFVVLPAVIVHRNQKMFSFIVANQLQLPMSLAEAFRKRVASLKRKTERNRIFVLSEI